MIKRASVVEDKMAIQRLKDARKSEKRIIRCHNNTNLLPFITMGDAGPLHMELNLTNENLMKLQRT